MIIYGYRNKAVEASRGHFKCPSCQMDREYVYINIVRYFTLFFIQLFPLGGLGSYVECQTCHSKFKPEEIVNTPGNAQAGADIAARKLAMDNQTKATRGRNMAIIGGVLMGLSVCALGILGVFFLDTADNVMEDLMETLLLAICPLGIMALGLGLLMWGINIRRKATETPVTIMQMG